MNYTQASKNNLLLSKVNWTKKDFMVMEEFVRYLNFNNKNIYILVPKWFITDFGSIPRFMQAIFSPTHYIWYILHDFLYSKKSKILIENECEIIRPTRLHSDNIFKEAIQVEGAWKIKSWIIWSAVRLFWFLYFKKK